MRDDEPWADCGAFVSRVRRSSVHSVATRSTRLVLDDGRYDAFVVWVDERDDGGFGVELTITTGVHKGEVVELVATRLPLREPLDLVGLPCTLVVTDGVPSIEP